MFFKEMVPWPPRMIFLGCKTGKKLYFPSKNTYISKRQRAFIISSFLKEMLKEKGEGKVLSFFALRKN